MLYFLQPTGVEWSAFLEWIIKQMTCSLLPAAGTWLYSNKPYYPPLFVCLRALRWNTMRGTDNVSDALFSNISMNNKKKQKQKRWHPMKIKQKRTDWSAWGHFWSRKKRRLLHRWVFSSYGEEVEGTGMLGCYSAAAYVQRAIKVKDLQFSPGPQQPRTLLGITENDLQGGWTVRLPKLQWLLGNPNHIIPHKDWKQQRSSVISTKSKDK